MKDLEQKIIDAQHGKDAKPILHPDKSIAGLIAANCGKRERSRLFIRAIERFIP